MISVIKRWVGVFDCITRLYSTVLWDLKLLPQHECPNVRDTKNISGTPLDIISCYSVFQMCFFQSSLGWLMNLGQYILVHLLRDSETTCQTMKLSAADIEFVLDLDIGFKESVEKSYSQAVVSCSRRRKLFWTADFFLNACRSRSLWTLWCLIDFVDKRWIRIVLTALVDLIRRETYYSILLQRALWHVKLQLAWGSY